MFIVDERVWSYNLFLKGLDALEITDVLQYMNTEESCRLCGYFEEYPDYGRYFLKVSDSIMGFSVYDRGLQVEKFALSRFFELREPYLRVYYYNNKQRGSVPFLKIGDSNNNFVNLSLIHGEKLASGMMYQEIDLSNVSFVSGLYTLYVGEGVREVDIPLVFIGEDIGWDEFERSLGQFSMEFDLGGLL